MFLQTALIFCKEPKTDAALNAIMATHPWAPALIYGHRVRRRSIWEEEMQWQSLPDSIYIDEGYSISDEKWIVENFHAPSCFLPSLELADLDKQCQRQKVWWRAIRGRCSAIRRQCPGADVEIRRSRI
jgi:hypothetical protein